MTNINYMQVGDETHCLFCHLTHKDSTSPNHAVEHLQRNDTISPCTETCGRYFNWDKQKGSFCEKCGGEMLKWVEDCKFKCVCPQRQKDGSWVEQPTEGWNIQDIPSAPCECRYKECTKRLYEPKDIEEFVKNLLSQAKEEERERAKKIFNLLT